MKKFRFKLARRAKKALSFANGKTFSIKDIEETIKEAKTMNKNTVYFEDWIRPIVISEWKMDPPNIARIVK